MNINFSCLVIGTSLLERQPYFIDTLTSIDIQEFPFEKKVVAIDDFGEGMPKNLEKYCIDNNWYVAKGERQGMVLNQIRGLNNISSDWVLYCEDDIIINKLPPYQQLCELIIQNNVGLVSLVGGGVDFELNYTEILESIKKDVIKIGENETFWYRDVNIASDFHVEFPIEFLNRSLWLNLIDTARKNFSGIQIEQAYTKAFFKLGYENIFNKYTWAKDFNNYITFNETPKELEKKVREDIMHIKMHRNSIRPTIGNRIGRRNPYRV